MLREEGHHTAAPLQYVSRCFSPHHSPLFSCGAMSDCPHSSLGQVMEMAEHKYTCPSHPPGHSARDPGGLGWVGGPRQNKPFNKIKLWPESQLQISRVRNEV